MKIFIKNIIKTNSHCVIWATGPVKSSCLYCDWDQMLLIYWIVENFIFHFICWFIWRCENWRTLSPGKTVLCVCVYARVSVCALTGAVHRLAEWWRPAADWRSPLAPAAGGERTEHPQGGHAHLQWRRPLRGRRPGHMTFTKKVRLYFSVFFPVRQNKVRFLKYFVWGFFASHLETVYSSFLPASLSLTF